MMKQPFPDASPEQVDAIVHSAWKAFAAYRQTTVRQRADLLRAIASGLRGAADLLLPLASEETHLDEPRLRTEWERTLFQLNTYAAFCESGDWMDIRIDIAEPPLPDLRKMMVPLGPVAVFGASNFPFAYSTAGGDTACALAAGCPVIVKAHPAHAHTSAAVSAIIGEAVAACGLPPAVFSHVHGASFETGKALVLHPHIKAVGFTGSFEGGSSLVRLAAGRPEPIPVFAEMGSVNPVYLMPGMLEQQAEALAEALAQSMTQSGGQFCTNPGIIVATEGQALETFITALSQRISDTQPVQMLHAGIAQQFHANREKLLGAEGLEVLAVSSTVGGAGDTRPTLVAVKAQTFLSNSNLHREVFGPFSILVRCSNLLQMVEVAEGMEGQLTASLFADAAEVHSHPALLAALEQKCGRLIFNGVPTGVRVALAMHHGGPWPASSDSRFTAVGGDGIRRFARPVCYQNAPQSVLPPELKNENPLSLWRTINNELSKRVI